MHLFKAFQSSSSKTTQASSDTHPGHQESLILEPILTPSGLPFDVETENDTISDDRVELPDFGDADSDGDFLSGLDATESEGDSFEEVSPLAEEDGGKDAYAFFDPTASGFDSGTFIVGETGVVTIDYLFDGGGYQGELAIFSISGMNLPDTDEFVAEEFIREAARRIIEEPDLGHIAISDRAEGARFSGELGERDWNQGDYLGAKTFKMRPGDEIGFMLVPNGRVQEVLDNPAIGGARTPLFSLATANPDGMFHAGQIADVTGDGNTFVFEDLRVDGKSDLDYNDLIFQVRGAEARNVMRVEDITGAPPVWMETDLGEAIIAHALPDLPPVDYRFDDAAQPLVGVLDTGLNGNNPDLDYSRILLGKDWVGGDDNPLLELGETDQHGTQTLGLIGATQDNDLGIDGINDDAPLWVGRAVGSGQWSDSLIEFVEAAKDSGQPNAVVNLSFDLTQVDADGNVTTRYELTPEEQSAIEYARQNGVLIVAAAGNDGGVMSALGQASQLFDNIITVGAANGLERADFSSYGYGLDLLAEGFAIAPTGETVDFTQGTSVAAARVTGAASQVWAANPDLSYRQVIELLKATAQDVEVPGWDVESGFGLLNMAAAVQLAKVTSAQQYDSPEISLAETWSGEGIYTPLERAVNYDANKIINSVPSSLRIYAKDSISRILNAAKASGVTDIGQIAYILATAEHESKLGLWMEELASGQAYEGRADLGNIYPGDGVKYKGRGYVQITGRKNYTQWGQQLGINLVNQPTLASDKDIAAKILVQGMRDGTFTGKKLSHYINGGNRDFVNARRIVNGTDRASTIAQIANRYVQALQNAIGPITTPVNPVSPSSRRPYTIRRGDTLWAIAQRELGNGNRWREITQDAAGQRTFTDAEARRLQIGRTVYLPVTQQVGPGRPVVTPPVYTPPPGSLGRGSRAPYLFEQAYARIRGAQNNVRPTGNAERVGNGWVQKFKNSQGHESWLMLEDGAKTAFWVFGSNLVEYKFMGGPVGRTLDGRSVFLGYPRSDENVFVKDGKRAVWQAFATGNGTARIHNHYGAASVATWGVIGGLYTNMGGAGSFLGMPTRREYMDGDTTWAGFQGGKIAYHWPTGKVEALRHGQQPSWRRPPITYVNFSGRVGPSIGVNLRYSPRHEDRSNRNEPYNKTLQFDAWTTGETVTDLWLGTPDSRWFRVAGTSLWVPSAYIWGNPPSGGGGSAPTQPPLLAQQGARYFLDRPQFYGASGNGYAKYGFGSSINGTNRYREGNCTWYAFGRLKELGFNPYDVITGHPSAVSWGNQLRNGAQIVNDPQPGDVAQWHLNGSNHVAIVEKVEGNYVWLSESQAYADYDGNLPGSEIYPGAGTLHRVVKYTKANPHRYIRLQK
jgi:surface antigen